MARVKEGSHSFTCHPHVYPQVEWTIPAFNLQSQSVAALWLALISRPAEVGGWVGLSGLVKYPCGLPGLRRSAIPVAAAAGNRTRNHRVASPRPSYYYKLPSHLAGCYLFRVWNSHLRFSYRRLVTPGNVHPEPKKDQWLWPSNMTQTGLRWTLAGWFTLTLSGSCLITLNQHAKYLG